VRFLQQPFLAKVAAIPKFRCGQVFWLPDWPTSRAFPSSWTVALCGGRTRLQQRDCDGFAPFFPWPVDLTKQTKRALERLSLEWPPFRYAAHMPAYDGWDCRTGPPICQEKNPATPISGQVTPYLGTFEGYAD